MFQRSFDLRSATTHVVHQQRGTPDNPIYGVKGTTELSRFFTLPNGLLFDVMHLVYHGVSRSLLAAIIHKRLVDVQTLSNLTESVKVPHDFRRKPRNLLSDLKLWKSQEHKNFLLYIGPSVLTTMAITSPDSVPSQLLILYYLLSTAIFVLSSEIVSHDDISRAKELILHFQVTICEYFGRSVCTMSTHALIHLPDQVARAGPLTLTSTSTFENLNRQLKRSITGTCGQSHQMITRFMLSQSSSASASDSLTRVLGRLQYINGPAMTYLTNAHLSAESCANRFYANGNVFHSFDYGRKLRCASYYAFLSAVDKFVKIKFIFVNSTNIFCACRVYCLERKMHQMTRLHLPQNVKDILDCISPYNTLRKGEIRFYDASHFTHRAIICKSGPFFQGVRILNNWEHE